MELNQIHNARSSSSQTKLLLICLASILQGLCMASQKQKVLLVSMDGFRNDYLSMTETPNFDKMRNSGVSVPYVNNSFITSTFPSHYTMATGLFTESHGIVGNTMYDPVLNKTFSKRSHEPEWWEGGEPIWITATNAGVKTGVFFWPGSEVPIRGVHPAEWRNYNQSVPFEERVHQVITWLSRDGIDLAVMYFDEPDSTGHKLGPDDPQILTVVQRMDSILGLIVQELGKAALTDSVNLIITSDHGMSAIDWKNKVVDITDYVNSTLLYKMVGEGATTQLIPQPGKAQDLVNALSHIPNIHVMLKEDIPERFHLKHNRRVMDVFAYADEGWTITEHALYLQYLDEKGNHGFDNQLQNMKPIFLAQGPSFKKNVIVDPIQNVDLYPLVCTLLGIEPSPNNGSFARVQTLLRLQGDVSESSTNSSTSISGPSGKSPGAVDVGHGDSSDYDTGALIVSNPAIVILVTVIVCCMQIFI